MTDNVMKYRKKPVVIEARQYDGQNAAEIAGWLREHGVRVGWSDAGVRIPTLEGDMLASPGDWVIRGVQGEFYPCKDSIFRETYEQVTIAEMISEDVPDLDAIRARAEAAPEGPWFRHYNDVVLATAIGNGEDIDGYVMLAEAEVPRGDRRAMATAEFTAHARSDIPALLAEVERLREYIDRMPYPSDMDQLRAERDRAEAEAARWKAAWDMAEPLLTDLDRAKATIARVQELVDNGMRHVYVEQDDEYGVLLYDLRAAIEGTDS